MAEKTKTKIKKTVTSKSVVPSEVTSKVETKKYSGPLLNKKYLAVLAILVLAGALYLMRGLFVAATVNGYPISRFQIIKSLEKESGKRVLENVITKELINQEAKKKNVVVSDEDVKKQIEEIKKSLEGQGTTIEAALSMQGQTMQDLEDNIRLQKVAEKLLADKTTVSDDEIKKYFDENKDTLGKDAKYDEVKSQIESQLKSQKFQTEVEKFLSDLKTQYKINYFVSY